MSEQFNFLKQADIPIEEIDAERMPDDVFLALGCTIDELEAETDGIELPNEEAVSPNFTAASRQVLRGAALMAVGNWVEQQAQKRFIELEKDLVALVKKGGATGTTIVIGEQRIAEAFLDVHEMVRDALQKTAASVTRMAVAGLEAAHGIKARKLPAIDGSRVLVGGLTATDNISKLASDFALRFKAAIQLGEKNGDTPEQMAQRIVGEAANEVEAANAGLTIGLGVRLLDAVDGGFSKLIQSAVQALATEVDEGLLAELDEDEAPQSLGWQWLAALDEKVCERCAGLDGSRWDSNFEPVDDSEEFEENPPLHPNCRCQLVPVDLEADDLPAKSKVDNFLSFGGKKTTDAIFGKAASDAYWRGDISGKQMLATHDYAMTPEEFAEIKALQAARPGVLEALLK